MNVPKSKGAGSMAPDQEQQVAIVLIGVANCLDLMVRNKMLGVKKELDPAVPAARLTK
jgi:hypothetical protein